MKAKTTDGRTVEVSRADQSDDERDPIVCPACGGTAQWRKTIYSCRHGHQWTERRR